MINDGLYPRVLPPHTRLYRRSTVNANEVEVSTGDPSTVRLSPLSILINVEDNFSPSKNKDANLEGNHSRGGGRGEKGSSPISYILPVCSTVPPN